ncbi:hypothetical protein P9Z56_29570 [Bacillus cereus]|nr:hypothetical protein [Bacillus cereus]MEC2754869.1 hypothetical protein [Bacillus cereus]MEC2830293.1 hypothetical protein [Bacillus cereus]
MEFLFELLKEIARAVMRELSAFVLRKRLQNPTLRRREYKRGSKKDNA